MLGTWSHPVATSLDRLAAAIRSPGTGGPAEAVSKARAELLLLCSPVLPLNECSLWTKCSGDPSTSSLIWVQHPAGVELFVSQASASGAPLGEGQGVVPLLALCPHCLCAWTHYKDRHQPPCTQRSSCVEYTHL